MTRPGIAVVGCGWAGGQHTEAFAAEGAQVLWAADTDPARAAFVDGRAKTATWIDVALEDERVVAFSVLRAARAACSALPGSAASRPTPAVNCRSTI